MGRDKWVGQLRGELKGLIGPRVEGLIQEATEEALAEARQLVKEAVVQAILEAVSERVAGSPEVVVPPQVGQPPAEQSIAQILPVSRAGEDAPGWGCYVYAVTSGNGTGRASQLPDEGIDPAYPVYLLRYGSVQAIVSKVSIREFSQEQLETNLSDPEWLKSKVCAHQSILQSLAADCTVLPVRFCTVYLSEDRVQEMLAQHHDRFVASLARLAGKREWGVKVYLDEKALAAGIDEVSEEVRALRAEMVEKPSGMLYFLQRKLDQTIADEMERASSEYAQDIHDRLRACTAEAALNDLQSKQVTGRQEEMVLNGAYLVPDEAQPAFEAELAAIGDEYGALGFSGEVTGPWPPYSFVAFNPAEGAADESDGS